MATAAAAGERRQPPLRTPPASTLSTATTLTPATVAPADVKTGTKVVVANASGVGGVAGKMTDEIKAVGFDTGKATNSTGPKLSTTVIYYDSTNPAALAGGRDAGPDDGTRRSRNRCPPRSRSPAPSWKTEPACC